MSLSLTLSLSLPSHCSLSQLYLSFSLYHSRTLSQHLITAPPRIGPPPPRRRESRHHHHPLSIALSFSHHHTARNRGGHHHHPLRSVSGCLLLEWSANMMEEEAKRKLKAAELQAKKTRISVFVLHQICHISVVPYAELWNKHQRGEANGIAMTCMSLFKSIGPATGGAIIMLEINKDATEPKNKEKKGALKSLQLIDAILLSEMG
ncbi:hypothetical protein RIF29_29842 [Crotalaria pallida]|uniref:Uncharacterized protein n=1 Tax=Crotalaria pallida TaxID=3830 RepID=A0AAN9EM34_CROPI